MVLFLSDIHLGRSAYAESRRQEAELIDFLRAMRSNVEHLYLLGDVFEDYIEYRHVIPKGYARFQGLLAEFVDAGMPITYLVGNHDPWHRDYFEREIGVTIEHDGLEVTHDGRRLYLAHGDRIVSTRGLIRWLKGWLRHPVPVWIYKHLLPSDVGISLARFVNSTFGKRELNHELIADLRRQARQILSEKQVDSVVLGHSHFAELQQWPEGDYLNTGYWHDTRTFGSLADGSLQLLRWNGHAVDIVER